MTNPRFEPNPRETQFVRDQLDQNPDPTEDEETEIAQKLLDHLANQLHATALYHVRRLAAQSRSARRILDAQG